MTQHKPTERQHRSLTNTEIPAPPLPTKRQVGTFLAYFIAVAVGASLVPEISTEIARVVIDLGITSEATLESATYLHGLFEEGSTADVATNVATMVGVFFHIVWATDFGEDGFYTTWLHLASAAVVVAGVFGLFVAFSSVESVLRTGEMVSATPGFALGRFEQSLTAIYGLFFIVPATLVSVGTVRRRSDYRPLLVNVGIAGTLLSLVESAVQHYVGGWGGYSVDQFFTVLGEGFLVSTFLGVIALFSVVALASIHERLRVSDGPLTKATLELGD